MAQTICFAPEITLVTVTANRPIILLSLTPEETNNSYSSAVRKCVKEKLASHIIEYFRSGSVENYNNRCWAQVEQIATEFLNLVGSWILSLKKLENPHSGPQSQSVLCYRSSVEQIVFSLFDVNLGI